MPSSFSSSPSSPLSSSLPRLTREHVEASAQGTREGLANAKQFIKIKHKASIKGRGSGMEGEGEEWVGRAGEEVRGWRWGGISGMLLISGHASSGDMQKEAPVRSSAVILVWRGVAPC